ncbi:MAG: hypothetical protein ACXVLQ_08955 [Bacteriovorax sp.]
MSWIFFWKVALSAVFFGLVSNAKAAELQAGSLSEGGCWYEFKEGLKVASFNDKSVYMGTKAQMEAELEGLLEAEGLGHQKINEMDLSLHCGGYGASLVAKITASSNSFCVWSSFEKGKLALRSLGTMNEGKSSGLCDGHKWGELILGVQSSDLVLELQGPKWSSMIKEVKGVSDKVYKVTLVKDYEFREEEVINQLEENFAGKNAVRYIEFNEYRHPIGEYVPLK